MMKAVAKLVVEEYHGSLKAEHGTGRNMAPFVKYEWGAEAYEVMKELKNIFDPDGLLNKGVIFNDDPDCFIKHLKPLPVLGFDYSQLPETDSAREMAEGVKKANKCIECGFCEVNCVTCGLTLSSRMRIAVQREISRLEAEGGAVNLSRADNLRKQYKYYGDASCAADGLCATSCPMKINTGDVTHIIRELNMQHNTLGRCVGDNAAKNLSRCKEFIRLVLTVADIAHDILGTVRMTNITSLIHRVGLPLWTPAMPKAVQQPKENTLSKLNTELKVVYFPSCLNQTMGLAKGAPVKNSLVDEMCQLLNKAGFEVVFPENMKNLCCGQIWESKGMVDIADRKTRELEEALWEASNHGEYPVLCDQSPCLHRMRKLITRMKLFEPVEFIMTYLKDRLDFHPIDRRIAVHITCSTREMGLANQLVALAKLCSNNVLVPEGIGCCAFAGDKGFTHPEVNKYALRKLRPQIEEQHIEVGYSNSRTCEIGLQTNSGIPYISIAYLVNECTTSKQ